MDSKLKNGEIKYKLPELSTRYSVKSIARALSFGIILLLFFIVIAIIFMSIVNVDITIDAKGVLEPSSVSRIHAPDGGKITEVCARSSELVKKGDLLAVFDSIKIISSIKQYQSDLFQKEINLEKKKKSYPIEKYKNEISIEKAEASLLKAKSNFRGRLVDYFPNRDADSLLLSYKRGTHVALDNALADLLNAEADLKTRKSEIEMYELVNLDIKNMEIEVTALRDKINELQAQLTNLKILSPTEGYILTEDVEKLEGQFVAEGANLMDIAPLKSWDAVLFVPEREIHKIKVGYNVKIEIAALKTDDNFELLPGVILEIASEPNTNKDKYQSYPGLYRVLVAFDKPAISPSLKNKLKKGYSISGKIICGRDRLIKMVTNNIQDLF